MVRGVGTVISFFYGAIAWSLLIWNVVNRDGPDGTCTEYYLLYWRLIGWFVVF